MVMKRIIVKRKMNVLHHGDMRNSTILYATKLIEKRGDVVFTLREIAEGLGVSHVAVLRHFKDKAAIVAEIAKCGYQGLIREMELTITKDRGAVDCAKAYIKYGHSHSGEFRAMFHHSIKPFSQYPELLSIASRSYSILRDEVEKLKPGASPAVPLSIWGLAHGLTNLLIDNQIDGALGKQDSQSVFSALEAVELVVPKLMGR